MSIIENAHQKIGWEFVEYGKFFVPGGASEYYDLAYSEGMKELAYAKGWRELSSFFRTILSFPENTTFAQKLGVSVAFLPASSDAFIFVHIQRRRENEIPNSGGQLDERASMGRWFNQIRFSFIKKENLFQLFRLGYSGYRDLLMQETFATDGLPYVRDYQKVEGVQNLVIDISKATQQTSQIFAFLQNPLRSHLSDILKVKTIVDALIKNDDKTQVRIISEDLEVQKKLQIVESVQRLVYWKLGWLSFALDFVSDPIVPIKLQFLTPEDTKYFSHKFESVSIELSNLDADVFLKEPNNDYVGQVIAFIDQLKRSKKPVDQLWMQLNYKLMEELPSLQDPRICFAFNTIDLSKEPISLISLGRLINNVDVNSDISDLLVRIAENIIEEYRRLDGDLALKWWRILRNVPNKFGGRKIMGFYEYLKNLENIPEELIRCMLVEIFEFLPEQKIFSEFLFWKNKLNEPIKDPALRYIVNHVDNSPPILSYWDVAIDLSAGSQDLAQKIFVLLISSALEVYHQNPRNRESFSGLDIKALFSLEQTARVFATLLNKIIAFGLFSRDLFDRLLTETKDILALGLIKDIMINPRWNIYWYDYKNSIDANKLYKRLEPFPELADICSKELLITDSGRPEISPIPKPASRKRTKRTPEPGIDREIENNLSQYLLSVICDLDVNASEKKSLHYESLVDVNDDKEFLIEFVKISLDDRSFLSTLLIRSIRPGASKELVLLAAQTIEHVFVELAKVLRVYSFLEEENPVETYKKLYISIVGLYRLSLKSEIPNPALVYSFLVCLLPCFHFIAQQLISKLGPDNYKEIVKAVLNTNVINIIPISWHYLKRQKRKIKEKHFNWLLTKVYSNYISLLRRSESELNLSLLRLINPVENMLRQPTLKKVTGSEPALEMENDHGSSYIFFILALHYAHSHRWDISDVDREYYIKYIRPLDIDPFEIKFRPKHTSKNKVDWFILGCIVEIVFFIAMVLLLAYLK